MPFGNIVSGSNTFEPRNPGIYSLSSVTFVDPRNEFRIRGASANGANLSATVTRYVEKDVTVGGLTNRLADQVSIQILVPRGTPSTATEIDALATDLATFLTAATISRLLQGES